MQSNDSGPVPVPTDLVASLTARYAARNASAPVLHPQRLESLIRAVELGATDATIDALIDALRVGRSEKVILPPHHLETLSRGSGWCRQGRGSDAVWGERVDGGYRVGPGRWIVGGSDGFSRKKQETWDVKHVRVGGEIWTVAS
jgi:hypothetical protein